MSLTFSSILSLEVMTGAELLVEGDNFNSPVAGITIMESPDISKWVDEGQVILSSLFSISGHEDTMDDFVRELKECKIGGFIIKPRYSQDLYDALISACKKYKLNLVKIPQSTLYTDILQSVMGHLFSYQLSRANHFKTCHEVFMKIALEGEGAQSIVDSLKDFIRHDIIAYDTFGHIVASSNEKYSTDDLVVLKGNYEKLKTTNLEYHNQTILIGDCAIRGTAIPYKALKRIKGYLFIDNISKFSFNEYEWIAIESAINVLNLEMTKQLAVTETEQRFKNDLLSDLLIGNIPSQNMVLQRAGTIGWDLSKPHIAVVLNFKFSQETHSKENISSIMQSLQNMLNSSLSSSENMFANQNIIGIFNDTFTILWAYDTSKSHEKNILSIKQTIDKLFENSRKQFELISYCGGIGNEINNIYDISHSYDEAVNAMKYGQIIYGDNMGL